MISLAAGARGWLWLLFSPFGAVGRLLFICGAAAVVVLNVALAWTIGHHLQSPYVPVVVCVLTLPAAVCVTAKRLHAIGRSGWWQAPVRLIFAAGVVSTAVYQHHRDWPWLAQLPWKTMLAGATGDLVLFVWLAVAPNRRPAESVVEVFD